MPMAEPLAPSTAVENQAAAVMLASGRFTPDEILEVTGLSEQALQTLRRSPLFQRLVHRFAEAGIDEQRQRLLDALMRDADHNLRFIQDLREGMVDDSPQVLAIRKSAALALLDRALPPAKVGGDAATAVQINIGGEVAERFDRAFAEAKQVDNDDDSC
jgi:hypothetical protein